MEWRPLWSSLQQMMEIPRQKDGHSCHPGARPKANVNTKSLEFSDLPPELVVLIASMLSTPSATCLSLCNRAMSQILGPNVWPCLNLQNPDIRCSFLSDLSKDLPKYFVCYRCVQLHVSSAVQWPRTTPKTLTRCLGREPAFEHCTQSGLLLRFPHIQLAMKRYYFGPNHGFPMEAFHRTVVTESDLIGNTVLLSVDTQIVSNELLMRSQQWVLLPHDRRNELVSKRHFHHLCHHIWALGKAEDNLPTLVKSRLDLLEEQGQCHSLITQCLQCPMDFVMDAVDLGERGVAGCLTRWINLGAGLHPSDPKWQSHLGKSQSLGVTYQPHPLGSICSNFENQTAMPFEELTAKSVYSLLSRRERKPFTRRADGLMWKLVCCDPHRWSLESTEESLGWGPAVVLDFLSKIANLTFSLG